MSFNPPKELLAALERSSRRRFIFRRSSLAKPNSSKIESILDERKKQRAVVFWFSIISAGFSMLFLFTLISFQVYKRLLGDGQFRVLDSIDLDVLSVSIFGQVISVILVIANSVWNHGDFKDIYQREWDSSHGVDKTADAAETSS